MNKILLIIFVIFFVSHGELQKKILHQKTNTLILDPQKIY